MRIEAATATTATTSDEDDANDDGDGDERRRHGYDTTTRTEHCHPSRAEAGYDDAATTTRDDDVTAATMRHDDDDTTTSRAKRCSPRVPLTIAAAPGAPDSRCTPWCPSQSLPRCSLAGAAAAAPPASVTAPLHC